MEDKEISRKASDSDVAPINSNVNIEIDTKNTTINMVDVGKKQLDEADDKASDNESKPLREGNDPEAAFTPDKQNGEANVYLGKTAFVGMGKEELMKYANDPFWIRLRWILFVLFWLTWLAMLVGAIIIIVTAPKCSKPEERVWWETEIMLKSENYDTIDEDINTMINNDLKTIILKSPKDSYLSPNSEDLKEMKDAIQKALNNNFKVVVGLNPIATNVFGWKSDKKGDENDEFQKYKDYYIWKIGSVSQGQKMSEPNNWRSYIKRNESAWEFNEQVQKFIYKPGSEPVLNFRHEAVPEEFIKVMDEWLDLGINGFELYDVPYMFVSEDMKNEEIGNNPGSVHTDYNFWRHSKTKNLEEIGNVLLKWRDYVKNKNNDAVFMLSDDLDTLEPFKVNNTLTIDLPKHSTVFTNAERLAKAKSIYDGIDAAFRIVEDYSPVWEQIKSDRINNSTMNILTMLLPGTVIIDRDFDNKIFKKIKNLRSDLRGKPKLHLLANDTVFAYEREGGDNSGIIVVYNPSKDNITVNFAQVLNNPSSKIKLELTNYVNKTEDISENEMTKSPEFEIISKSAMVLSFK